MDRELQVHYKDGSVEKSTYKPNCHVVEHKLPCRVHESIADYITLLDLDKVKEIRFSDEPSPKPKTLVVALGLAGKLGDTYPTILK